MTDIGGVNVAAITPRREGPEIDLASAFELIDFLGQSGVAGIALLGSTGEFTHFTLEERARLIRLSVKRSRIPVIAGVAHTSLAGAVFLGREAVDSGAAALLVMPPYFFRYAQEDIRQFFLSFAAQVGGSVPILLYNIPQFGNGIEPATAVELLETGRFAGIKDSSGVWMNFLRLNEARARLGFSLLVGHDALFTPARNAGANGIISGVASAIPELLVALDRAITSGNAARAQALDTRLQEFLRWIDRFPAPAGIREACAVRGLKTGPRATVLAPGNEIQVAAFRDWFKNWLPIMLEESKHA
ncbi:MAG TPA: dihydrodipicolinate synthase family protein [Bryobacteraceae bacterium]|nr:dihydrodipicolinate synthase family protein [Bryobacteraceae bacterium]